MPSVNQNAASPAAQSMAGITPVTNETAVELSINAESVTRVDGGGDNGGLNSAGGNPPLPGGTGGVAGRLVAGDDDAPSPEAQQSAAPVSCDFYAPNMGVLPELVEGRWRSVAATDACDAVLLVHCTHALEPKSAGRPLVELFRVLVDEGLPGQVDLAYRYAPGVGTTGESRGDNDSDLAVYLVHASMAEHCGAGGRVTVQLVPDLGVAHDPITWSKVEAVRARSVGFTVSLGQPYGLSGASASPQ